MDACIYIYIYMCMREVVVLFLGFSLIFDLFSRLYPNDDRSWNGEDVSICE